MCYGVQAVAMYVMTIDQYLTFISTFWPKLCWTSPSGALRHVFSSVMLLNRFDVTLARTRRQNASMLSDLGGNIEGHDTPVKQGK